MKEICKELKDFRSKYAPTMDFDSIDLFYLLMEKIQEKREV